MRIADVPAWRIEFDWLMLARNEKTFCGGTRFDERYGIAGAGADGDAGGFGAIGAAMGSGKFR